MPGTVCLDASFVIACLIPEEMSPTALSLWERWLQERTRAVAPPLLRYEVISGLRRAVHLGRISEEEGERALDIFFNYDIALAEPEGLLRGAWTLGKQLGFARLYDAFYLALGALLDCEVWTVDRRLYDRARPHFPFLRWVGHVQG